MVSPADILNAKVLIVDDQEANVRLLERMLRNAGYASVARTMDPYEVGGLHRTNRYDLIVLDLQMPGMDGFQVMEGLKDIEEDGDLTVLVMTAHPGHKLRALQAGAKDFISKPFDGVEVLTRIRNMLEARLLRAEARSSGREPVAGRAEGPIVVRPDDEIRHLAPEFLEKRRDDVLSLTEALAQNDFARIQRLGQRLNGTGLSYGFNGISEIGSALEKAARIGDVEELRRRVALLSDYLQRVNVIA
jgi:DNA-binding response OmpR family regulator